MKIAIVLLLALGSLLWLYIKSAAKKANAMTQVNIHLEKMYDHLINHREEESKKEFELITLKSLEYPEILEYLEKLPNTRRNKICLDFMKYITEQQESNHITQAIVKKSTSQKPNEHESNVVENDPWKPSQRNSEIDSIAVNIWKKFDEELINSGEEEATEALTKRVTSTLISFINTNDKSGFERFTLCLDIQANQQSKPNRFKAYIACHSEINEIPLP